MIQVYSGKGFSAVTQATMGVDFITMMKKPSQAPNNDLKVHVWDTAGAERFRSISLAFYKRAQGAVICFDMTRRDSFEHVTEWANSARENCPENVVTMLVGTKCDLEGEREIDQSEAQQLASDNNMQYMETSAKEGININEMFQAIIDQVYVKQGGAVGAGGGLGFSQPAAPGSQSN